RNPLVREALALLRDAAQALQAVHAADAVNRDVKGENLLVDEKGRLVLLDLGVGDYAGAETLTDSPLPPGTRCYRSPEALRFEKERPLDFDTRYAFHPSDDLYALGVTGYRLLTDELPFESEGEDGARQALLAGRMPEAPRTLNPRVPPAVSDLLLRLLALQPEARPASAQQVADELDALLRQGGSELEAHLFEWDDGPSLNSRTTENAEPQGPVAPGHEASVERDVVNVALRQDALRNQRRLRRRPRPPGATAASARLARRWLPGKRTALVVGGMLLLLLPAGLVTGLYFAPNDSPQEGASMHESKPSPLLTLLTTVSCLVIPAGCASVPVSPTWPKDCPPEALAAMKKYDIEPGDQNYIQVDINRQGGASEFVAHREGPIVSYYSHRDDSRPLPEGTKVYGYLWMGKKKTHLHWDRAELPDGQQIPFCGVLGFDEKGGYWIEEGPEPGTRMISRQAAMTITSRFERPE
ncbi:MAG TPA: protein kinase, partial [Myxococcaceae bacterium]|nr:protein kinase [Myxococcaceae bacterium]